jgi:hypothetical protein
LLASLGIGDSYLGFPNAPSHRVYRQMRIPDIRADGNSKSKASSIFRGDPVGVLPLSYGHKLNPRECFPSGVTVTQAEDSSFGTWLSLRLHWNLLSKPEMPVYFLMADSRSFTNSFQFLLKPLVLLPFGHHWTLPRPNMSFPRSSSPERTSRYKELLVLLFVNSTVETWLTTTVVNALFFAIGLLPTKSTPSERITGAALIDPPICRRISAVMSQ